MTDGLHVIPVSLAEANEFVHRHHRHHDPVVGHKFSIGAATGAKVRGVAIIGRPVARMNDDGWTLEVLRVATDGFRNTCSCLYGAARRAAWALGYRRLITYILESEPGTSLVAAGWKCLGKGVEDLGIGLVGRESMNIRRKASYSLELLGDD